MNHRLSDFEWVTLCEKLGSTSANQLRRRSAEACIYKHSHRHSQIYRSFGWHHLPEDFHIDPVSTNRLFRRWSSDGSWLNFWDALLELRYGKQLPRRPQKDLEKLDPIQALLLELQRAYDWFNRRFFGGALPKTVSITIDTTSKRFFGYTYFSKTWVAKSHKNIYHIAITNNAIDVGAEQILHTLMHEMAHLYNAHLGIADTDGRTQYHTQDFRDIARIGGLDVVSRDIAKGCAHTTLTSRGLLAIKTLKPVESIFGLRFMSVNSATTDLTKA